MGSEFVYVGRTCEVFRLARSDGEIAGEFLGEMSPSAELHVNQGGSTTRDKYPSDWVYDLGDSGRPVITDWLNGMDVAKTGGISQAHMSTVFVERESLERAYYTDLCFIELKN